MKLQKKDSRFTVAALTLAVAGLWGTIIYRVISHVNPVVSRPDQLNFSVMKDPVERDTFLLSLDYDDPFRVMPQPLFTLKKSISPPTQSTKQILNMPVVYHGIVKTLGSEEVALIAVNGKYSRVREHERVGEYFIVSISKDSIGIKVARQTRFVKRYRLAK